MKIRKLFALAISLAVLIIVSLPVSFAVDPPPTISTPLAEPDVSLSNGDLNFYIEAYYPGETNDYHLYVIHAVSSNSSAKWFIEDGTQVHLWSDSSFTVEVIDYIARSGVLFTQKTWTSGSGSYTYQGVSYSYTQRLASVNWRYAFYNIPVSDSVVQHYDDGLQESYINFSASVPDQNQYHSPLSEPVADQFNSYMVIDDHLIWVSYRVNGIYTRSSNIESASELYSQSVQISESGTGSYSGSSNGYTEDVSVPEGSFQGRETDYSRLFAGVYSGYDLGNIDFSSVNQGSVHFNSSGTVTFNDKEYYPVSFSQTDILSLYRLYCIPTDKDNFVFWLAPDRSLAQNTVVNMDFFFSEFDLDGNYIKSSFHSVTNTDLGLFDSYESDEDISSIRCYGIDFYNLNNLPFNLSSVLWEYDIDFAKWRDEVKTLLQSIYNTLSSDPSAPAPETYPNYADEIPSVEIVSGASPEDAGNLFGRSQNIVPQESIFAINQWREFFNIPDLIGACMFALTVGTIIIILGKRKSE